MASSTAGATIVDIDTLNIIVAHSAPGPSLLTPHILAEVSHDMALRADRRRAAVGTSCFELEVALVHGVFRSYGIVMGSVVVVSVAHFNTHTSRVRALAVAVRSFLVSNVSASLRSTLGGTTTSLLQGMTVAQVTKEIPRIALVLEELVSFPPGELEATGCGAVATSAVVAALVGRKVTDVPAKQGLYHDPPKRMPWLQVAPLWDQLGATSSSAPTSGSLARRREMLRQGFSHNVEISTEDEDAATPGWQAGAVSGASGDLAMSNSFALSGSFAALRRGSSFAMAAASPNLREDAMDDDDDDRNVMRNAGPDVVPISLLISEDIHFEEYTEKGTATAKVWGEVRLQVHPTWVHETENTNIALVIAEGSATPEEEGEHDITMPGPRSTTVALSDLRLLDADAYTSSGVKIHTYEIELTNPTRLVAVRGASWDVNPAAAVQSLSFLSSAEVVYSVMENGELLHPSIPFEDMSGVENVKMAQLGGYPAWPLAPISLGVFSGADGRRLDVMGGFGVRLENTSTVRWN